MTGNSCRRPGRVPAPKVRAGLHHLHQVDPVLATVIHRVGPFRLQLERDPFRALVRSIISQQISGGAAESIFRRLLALLGSNPLAAEYLARFTAHELRTAGISPQKAAYLLDLAEKVLAGAVRLSRLAHLADDAVVAELIQVKGIGVWTAQMVLIFSLGRLDVFPAQDLGVRVALRNLYELPTLPDTKASERIAAPWKPFSTLASWYCWRSLELPELKKICG